MNGQTKISNQLMCVENLLIAFSVNVILPERQSMYWFTYVNQKWNLPQPPTDTPVAAGTNPTSATVTKKHIYLS